MTLPLPDPLPEAITEAIKTEADEIAGDARYCISLVRGDSSYPVGVSTAKITERIRAVALLALSHGAAAERARIEACLRDRLLREVRSEAYRIAREALAVEGVFLGPAPDDAPGEGR